MQKDIRVSTGEVCETLEVFVQVKIDNMKRFDADLLNEVCLVFLLYPALLNYCVYL